MLNVKGSIFVFSIMLYTHHTLKHCEGH